MMRSLPCLTLIALVGCQGAAFRPAKTTFAEDALRPYVESGELPGAISVYYEDGVQETACVGYADVAAGRSIALDNVFMQCSQTKGFCGVTVAILVEEGKLSLDDPVSKYLPEFKELWVDCGESNGVRRFRRAKAELTVRMCLNHTGGFWFELDKTKSMGGWSRRMPLRSVAVVAAFEPLKFDPGTQASYSNVGIDIAAAVVEVVTGRRWEDFLRERILEPLGMDDTGFWPTDRQLAHKIELYDVKPGERAKWKPQAEWMQRPYNDDRVFPSAGAGLWTTAHDQLKFYKMLMNLGVGENGVRILREGTVRNLLAVTSRPNGLVREDWTRDGYSLGLCAPKTDTEDSWFGHGGAWRTSCYVNWHRKQLKMIVVQVEGDGAWSDAHARAADLFFRRQNVEGRPVDSSGRLGE